MACLWAGGCDTLADFSGDYEGTIVGSDGNDCDPSVTPCSFIRRGFPEGTTLSLTGFDPSVIEGEVGRLSTQGASTFEDLPLRTIAPLQHDLLSRYELPGSARVKNFIYVARPTHGSLAGRRPLVFISLMDKDRMEVRVVSGEGEESEGDHFGLFLMERTNAQ